ncbi:MAG TPA: sugar-binding protein [Vicinamibacteria bacterium]|nr:sugar-binding protein [Vicinamibacteria bacterium]
MRHGFIACVIVLVLGSGPLDAQTGLDLMDVDIMFVGAHPDDDTAVLATLARYLLDEAFRGTVVTATGGDGGGNAIGPEAGRALALIRKEEERRALALVGVESPSFLGLTDFYFTLSAEEASRRWGESFVCDIVRHVRLERPEVIVTMWPGPGTHGQHQMAARAATIAYAKAGDSGFCGEHIRDEHLAPFEPLKLYYANRDAPTTVAIPSSDFSRASNRSFAEIAALATSQYRSQGFDRFARIPVEDPRPQRFMLVRSRVPVGQPERHLLEGALIGVGSSPAGVRFALEPEAFSTGIGQPLFVAVRLEDARGEPFDNAVVTFQPPAGWSVESTEGGAILTPTDSAALDVNARLFATYRTEHQGHPIEGSNFTWLRARAPIRAEFVPLYDIASYRDFARETRTEWVIETLPTRVPLLIGRTNDVRITVSNTSAQSQKGTVTLDLPEGVVLRSGAEFVVPARGEVELRLELAVDERVLPEGRHSAKIPMRVTTEVEGRTSSDSADVYTLPVLEIPRVPSPPRIDGELEDTNGWPGSEISPRDLWWRREPDGAADSSASFRLAYDEDYLYIGARVLDDVVVCNIAPDDIKAQLRSDAIGITVDPSGTSQDTATVLQAAAFPCTTEGFGARGFRDADANQGPMEQTAPGMEVASRRSEDGYTFEARIPWNAMPHQPKPGDEIGLNVVIYDGDDADARVGANISESGLAWAAFEWGGKQALPYLWPRVVLGR